MKSVTFRRSRKIFISYVSYCTKLLTTLNATSNKVARAREIPMINPPSIASHPSSKSLNMTRRKRTSSLGLGYSSEQAVDFPTRDTSVCIFCSKTCVDHVWLVNVQKLALLGQHRRSSLPFHFLADVVHSSTRPLRRLLTEDHVYTSLLASLYEIWCPGLCSGNLIWVQFWAMFSGPVLGPYT